MMDERVLLRFLECGDSFRCGFAFRRFWFLVRLLEEGLLVDTVSKIRRARGEGLTIKRNK